MIVRPYQPSDEAHFRAVHEAQGTDYQFPALDSPLFIVKTVVERAGRPTTLLAGRLEVEAYLMTSGAPREKLEDIEAAQAEFLAELWAEGIDSAYAMVPDNVNRYFAKRMERLGWAKGREGWNPWTRDTLA